MPSLRVLAVAVVSLLVLSGCSGVSESGSPTASTTVQTTTTSTSTTPASTTQTTTTVETWRQTLEDRTNGEKSNWLYVEGHYNATARNRTDSKRAFENLSTDKRREFEQAIENGGKLDDPDAWTNPAFPRYVYYNDTWYSVMVTVG